MALSEVGVWLFGLVALFFVIWLLRYSLAQKRFSTRSCRVSSKSRATYYRGHPRRDQGFTMAQKKSAYKKANGRCECCKRKTIFGQANTRAEYALGFLTNAIEGQGHHCVPREFGGKSVDENIVWLCAPCNNKISDEWTLEAEHYCRAHGEWVYLEGKESARELRSWEQIVNTSKVYVE